MRTLVMRFDKIVSFGVVSTSELTFQMKIKTKIKLYVMPILGIELPCCRKKRFLH